MLKLSNLLSRRFLSSSCVLSKNINNKDISSRLHDLLSNMPNQEEVQLKDVRKVRMEKRTKRFLVQPTNISWQILGCGSYGGPTSLLLHTDHRKYLFNCGEGTQRLTNQLSLGRALARLEHVFITSKTWRHLGGLPGVCLTARAAGAPDITIHGPPGCMELYQATKGFLTLFEFNVMAHTADDGVFEDGAVKVEQVMLERSVNKKCPNLPENWKEEEQGEFEDYGNTVQAYICHFSPKPGKLDIEKCEDLGVKPGPILGTLKAGKDVTLDDGKVVRSCDVVGDAAPPSTFLVLDVPDLEYLDSLQSSKELMNLNNLETVFHFSPYEVVTSPRYKQWLEGVGETVNHILLNESCKGLGSPDVTAYTHKLRMIRREFFPELVGAQDNLADTDVEKTVKINLEEFNTTVMQGVTGLRVNVRPNHLQKIDFSEVVRFDEELTNRELIEGIGLADPKEREEYVELMKEDLKFADNFNPDPVKSLTAKLAAIDGVDLPIIEKTSSSSFPVITFLGTGSSSPSKYRNVSGILVETEPGSFLMMDCGEGTISQLVRMMGRVGAEKVLMGLKGVYISHMHADHHLGLINIIQLRESAFISRGRDVKKLYIISTSRLSEFLTGYHSKFEPVLSNAELVKCEHLVLYNARDEVTLVEDESKKHQFLFPDTLERVLSDLGLVELFTARAIHCPHAFCLAMRTTAGYKLAYSGDTRPCQKFRDICAWGGGPDLLIHEATMEHFMMNDAVIKKHSTFTEAIQEGQAMGAKFTMLTHFSQRYAKMPTLDEIKGKPNVGIAFDNMVVRPDNMKMIPSIYPALTRFLWDYQEELSDRAEQYKARYVEGGALATQLGLEDFPSPMEEKIQLAEKLQKRYQDKTQWFLNVKKRKMMMKQQEEEVEAEKKKVAKVEKKL